MKISTVNLYGNDVPTFAGLAFADYGFWSLISYLFLGGMILGLIRKFVNSHKKNPLILLGYIFFLSSMANATAESGFLNLFYLFVFMVAIILSAIIFIRLFVLQFIGRVLSLDLGRS